MTTYPAPSPPYVGPAKHTMGSNNKPIYRIVIHATVGAEPGVNGAARGVAAMFRIGDRFASAHYVVDAAETVQVVYDSLIAEHAPPNQHSLGIELCCLLSDEGKGHWVKPDHVAMLKRAATLVAGLCLAYDVPIAKLSSGQLLAGKHGICGHIDVSNAWHQTSHWDPGPYFPWDTFLAMVEVAAENIKHPTPTTPTLPPAPAPTPKPPRKKRRKHHKALADGEFVHVHTSGLGTSERKLLDEEIHSLAGVADLITTTEDYTGGRKKALRERGFTVLIGKGGNDQCAILPKDATWTVVASGSETLTDLTYYHTDGTATLPIKATWAVLEHKVTSKRLLVIAGHYPPSIEGQTGEGGIWSKVSRRVLVMGACVTGLKKLKKSLAKHYAVDATALCGDWNLDIDRPAVRAWFKLQLPRFRSTWDASPASKGTLGKRFIDITFVRRLKITTAPRAYHTPASDHRYVVETLSFEQ